MNDKYADGGCLLKQMSSPTPFRLEDAMHIKTENAAHSCSHAQIDQLISKKIINPIDLEIMKLLTDYRYVNTYNINYAINHSLPTVYQKKSYHANLKKLTHAGILLRHCIMGGATGNAQEQCASPLRFYSLPGGAYTYLAPSCDHPRHCTTRFNDRMIMENLALNQFLIRIRTDCEESIRHLATCINKKIGTHAFILDAFIRYMSHSQSVGFKNISLFVFSTRDFLDGIADMSSRMQLFSRWLHKHQEEHPNYMIIILTESIKNIPLLHAAINAKEVPARYPFYFCTDTALLTAPVFSCLFTCSSESGMVDIVRKKLNL